MSVREAILRAERGTHPQLEGGESCDERGLVAQAKSGSSVAFGELYERHRVRVYRAAFTILRQQQDAEDALQRCFQRAFTNLARFRGDSTFSTWLTRIAINEALMMLRQRRTNTSVSETRREDPESSAVLNLCDGTPSPEQIVAQNELCSALTQAISRLRKSLRTVVLLRDLQELTSEETARHLGLSVAAVKARIFHARRRLRRDLEQSLRPARLAF
jgi:RNA polymerase sigma-70 factor (ECF subfamily)